MCDRLVRSAVNRTSKVGGLLARRAQFSISLDVQSRRDGGWIRTPARSGEHISHATVAVMRGSRCRPRPPPGPRGRRDTLSVL